MRTLTNEEILRDYPLSGLAPGWYFKRSIDASGLYHIKGVSLDGHETSMSGDHPDEILKECVLQAGRWSGSHDWLTGIWNRKRFTSDVSVMLQGHSAIHLPLAVILMDMDQFKLTNDQLGHVVGDQILVRIANLLTTIGHQHGASLYRVGGDEFAAILTHTNKKKVRTFVQDIHNRMKDLEFDKGQTFNNLPYTLTAGVAITRDGDISADQLLMQADKDLYRLKRAR